MADNFIDTPADPEDDRLQMVAAVLLGLAAIMTAVASYYSAIKGGDSADTRADSGRTLADANFFFAKDTQTFAQDQTMFVQYAAAYQAGNSELTDYLTTLMRPEMASAVEWWLATDEATTPFDDIEGNPYYAEGAQADLEQAQALQAEADEQVEKAGVLDATGDNLDLSVTVFALTLFFGGIGTLFRNNRVTTILLALGAVAFVIGMIRFVTAF